MDESGEHFLQYIKAAFPYYFTKKKILDTGAYHPQCIQMFNDCTLYSSDLTKDNSKRRELISYKNKTFADNTFDMILSIECLENDEYYEESLLNLYKMLAFDGLFVIVIKPNAHNIINIHKLNELLHFHKQFSYWNCYKTADGQLLFIGMKKYVLSELPLQPINYEEYAVVNYNQKVVSIKNMISKEK